MPTHGVHTLPMYRSPLKAAVAWLNRVDPGANRRIKGLRLVTAYGYGCRPSLRSGPAFPKNVGAA